MIVVVFWVNLRWDDQNLINRIWNKKSILVLKGKLLSRKFSHYTYQTMNIICNNLYLHENNVTWHVNLQTLVNITLVQVLNLFTRFL